MNRKILITASIIGVLSVVLGAFAAHGLKELIAVEQLQSFETGVRYQIYHAFLLLFIGNTDKLTIKTKKTVFYLVIVGLLLFSGSIYGLATNTLSSFDFKQIALITPDGGLLLIVAWIVMGIGFIRNTDN